MHKTHHKMSNNYLELQYVWNIFDHTMKKQVSFVTFFWLLKQIIWNLKNIELYNIHALLTFIKFYQVTNVLGHPCNDLINTGIICLNHYQYVKKCSHIYEK